MVGRLGTAGDEVHRLNVCLGELALGRREVGYLNVHGGHLCLGTSERGLGEYGQHRLGVHEVAELAGCT